MSSTLRKIETYRSLVYEFGQTLRDIRKLTKAKPGESTLDAVRRVCRARAIMGA